MGFRCSGGGGPYSGDREEKIRSVPLKNKNTAEGSGKMAKGKNLQKGNGKRTSNSKVENVGRTVSSLKKRVIGDL